MTAIEHYTFKKGDSLDAIAKKHGLRGDAVWKAPENKALVAKRKKPDALVAGDDIVLPSSGDPKEKAQIQQSLATVKASIAQCQQTLHKYDQIQKTVDATRLEANKHVVELIKKLAKDQKMADFSAEVLTSVGTGIASLYSSAAKAATLKGAELAAENKKIVKAGLTLAFEPLKTAWSAGMISFGNAGSQAVEAVDTAARWLDQLRQPSYWAKKLYGKDPRDELMKLIQESNGHAGELINNISKRRAAVEATLATLTKVGKELEAKAH